MFEQFTNYPELKWMTSTAAQFIGRGDKIQINPDLENFKLKRFIDLRKQSKADEKRHFKLMLIGSSKTNVFVDGSDSLLDEMIKRLPKYIGRSWQEIKNISLERNFADCNNAFEESCDKWIIDNMVLDSIEEGKETHVLDLAKADEICSKCEHFDPIHPFNPSP